MHNIKIVRTNQKNIVSNLIQLYLYDMTEYYQFPIGKNGKYEYEMLTAFWQHPYLFYVDGELAGFALIIEKCPITNIKPCWFMAEFFILKSYRGKGVGKTCFQTLIKQHSGLWHVGVIKKNIDAIGFVEVSLPF